MDTQDYLEVNIIVASEEASEIIEAELMDLGFDSFMYKAPELKCYIQSDLFDEAEFNDALERLSSVVSSGILSFDTSSFGGGAFASAPVSGNKLSANIVKMPSVNWNAEWEKTGFTPIEVGKVTVLPLGAESRTSISIFLDPQMAFGTGHHNTTRMMMESIQAYENEIRGASVMDLGCGTAVLAILAAKLGAAKVFGIDIDAVAARSAQENVRINGENFPILCGEASSMEDNAYDFLLANIHRNIIIADMGLYARSLKSGGKLLLSGFYESDIPDIVSAASACGFSLCTPVRTSDSWACISLSK